jgi:hypothetical protein
VWRPRAPRRQQSDIDAAAVCFGDDEIDVIPIVIRRCIGGIRAGCDRGFCRIAVDERQVAVCVWISETVELGESDGLHDVVSLLLPQVEVGDCLLARAAVKQLPRGIAKIEKGLSIGGDDEPLIVADLQRGKRWARLRKCSGNEAN